MADTRFRAGSSKQLLWAAYSEQGKDAALKLAKREGIHEVSAKLYIAQFEKEETTPEPVSSRMREVFDIGDPQKVGKVITEGKEVSEVQWPGGARQYIPNGNLLPKGYFNNDVKGCYKNASKFVVMELNNRIDITTLFSRAKRMCSGSNIRTIYAVTSGGLVRLVPRCIWATFPNMPK